MPDYDVAIAGGGCAGLAAAVSAARLGARTLLVERGPQLGGQAPAALVHSICGLYLLAEESPPVFANRGFAEEFATRLLARGAAGGPVKMGRVWVLLTAPAGIALLADELCRETAGLDIRLSTDLIAADESGWTIAGRDGHEKVRARAAVDATGDGVLAPMTGAPFELENADRLQRPAFIFALDGVKGDAVSDDARIRLAGRIAAAVRDGRLPAGALGVSIRESCGGAVFVTIDLDAGSGYDPTDRDCVAAVEMEGKGLAVRVAEFLAREVEGFARCAVSQWPARLGIRESRRICGQARIETADLENGASPADAVAVAAWPMELRETSRGPRLRYPATGRPCGIPLGALRFRDRDDHFMAGRCISCSHEAQASIRVLGTCLATGAAAGIAAALHARDGACTAAAVRDSR